MFKISERRISIDKIENGFIITKFLYFEDAPPVRESWACKSVQGLVRKLRELLKSWD